MLAVSVAAALAQEHTAEEAGRLAAFFTVLGDTLALFALSDEC